MLKIVRMMAVVLAVAQTGAVPSAERAGSDIDEEIAALTKGKNVDAAKLIAVAETLANDIDKGRMSDTAVVRKLSDRLHQIWRPLVQKDDPLAGMRLAFTLLDRLGLDDNAANTQVSREFLKRISRDVWHRMARQSSPIEGIQAIGKILAVRPLPKGPVQDEVQAELIKTLLRKSWEPHAAELEPMEAMRTAVAVWEARPELTRRERDNLAREIISLAIAKLTDAAVADNLDFIASLALTQQHVDLIPGDVNPKVALEATRTGATTYARHPAAHSASAWP